MDDRQSIESAVAKGPAELHAKLFMADAQCTRILTELGPDDPDIAFGPCDLGFGYPELGSVRLSELESARGQLRLPVERDMHFSLRDTISVYARAAWNAGAITKDEDACRSPLRGEVRHDALPDLQAQSVALNTSRYPGQRRKADAATVYEGFRQCGVTARA